MMPLIAFYDMHAVMFVLQDEMADMSIPGLQRFILSHRPSDSHSKPYLHRKEYKIWNKKHQPAAILRITRKAVFSLSF